MQAEVSVVLIASASPYERQRLGRALEKTGWKLREVKDVNEAIPSCAADGGSGVLVIDSGLLEAPHSQWRTLRSLHPWLSAVVRCLIPRGAVLRIDPRTCLVHPEDVDGVREAIGLLNGLSIAPQRPPTIEVGSRSASRKGRAARTGALPRAVALARRSSGGPKLSE